MKLVLKLAAASVFALSAATAIADDFPSKSIRLIVPFAPGGSADGLGRLLASNLSERLGKQVVVENRSGAGGTIGADFVAKSPADGYTLLFATVGTQAINASLYKKMPYDSENDFTPIAPFTSVPNILVVNPKLQVRSVAELIAYSKSKPGTLNMGSAGSGTTNHLSGELLKSMTGASFVHVPYKGNAPAMTDLLANQIQLIFDNLPGSAIAHVRSGALLALAVTSEKRSPVLPDVPTMIEAGVPGYVSEVWYGVLGPKNLPKDVVARLSQEMTRINADKAMIEKLTNMGVTPLSSSPEQFAERIRVDREVWGKIVRDSGASVE